MLVNGVPLNIVVTYARTFLSNEIKSLEETLSGEVTDKNVHKLLIKRKEELEKDYQKLHEFE